MRANYWLLGLCCFCLGCAAHANSGYPHPESLFFGDNTIVYFLFVPICYLRGSEVIEFQIITRSKTNAAPITNDTHTSIMRERI